MEGVFPKGEFHQHPELEHCDDTEISRISEEKKLQRFVVLCYMRV